MKRSIYNFFIDWNNFVCGVNLFTGKKVVLLKDDYELYLKDLQQLSKSTYSILLQNGFIINDQIDEYARMLYRRNECVFYNNNTYRLILLPTIDCNFRCWYCYEQHIQSSMTFSTVEKVKKFVNYIIQTYPIFNFHLDWFGGEPMMYFKEVVEPISNYVKTICANYNIAFRNTMTTNGYLMTHEDIMRFKDLQLDAFQITLDGYRDIHNKTRFEKRGDDSYSRIIKNINQICNHLKDASITLRINYTSKNLENLGRIADDISPENRDKIQVSLQRVWQTKNIGDEKTIQAILQKEIACFEERNIKVHHNKIIYGSGMRCYADAHQQIVVNYDGSLYKCTARDFSKSTASVGSLGENGIPIWNNNYYKYLQKPIFENDKCKNCIFLPICLGSCSQKYVENGDREVIADCDPKEWQDSLTEELLQNLYDYIKSQARH